MAVSIAAFSCKNIISRFWQDKRLKQLFNDYLMSPEKKSFLPVFCFFAKLRNENNLDFEFKNFR